MRNLLRQFRKREWLFASLSLVFIVIQVWLDLKMPDYMNKITQISQGAVNPATGKAYELSDIWVNGRYMLGCAFGSMACSILTSFVIAHSLSTIRDADVIIYMQDGDIKETGTHEQLMQRNGLYAELYNSQFAMA